MWKKAGILVPTLVALFTAPAWGQISQDRMETLRSLTSTRESLAVGYPEGSTVKVEFGPTMRLPDGEGEAKVERRRGTTQIEVKLNNMKPATLFGGDFSTYVLWTVSPEGIAINTGEFVLDGDESKLEASTPLDMFGMFVTAEPHYLVDIPSRFVVLDNTGIKVRSGRATTKPVEYRAFDGVYDFDTESLVRAQEVKGEHRVDSRQATVAVALAERAGADAFAAAELRLARETLSKTIAAVARRDDSERVSLLAHEAVRQAVEAQRLAEKRSREAALEAERLEKQQQIDTLADAKEQADLSRREAEVAAANARREAESARMEREQALLAKAEAERATQEATTQQRQARELEQQAQREVARLQDLRAQAQREADESRAEATRFADLASRAGTQAERDRLAAEEARQSQQEALRAKVEAEAAAKEAQIEQQKARALIEQSRQRAEELEALKAVAESQAEKAKREAEEARSRMENALGKVVETRETARGVIINLPDILFDTAKAELRPRAREVLSRVAGILLVAPAYQLSIEGHTDNVGSDEYNQGLSERRAESVREYLTEAQVAPALMSTEGFGESRPLDSNDTDLSRQKNRRVEVVIENE